MMWEQNYQIPRIKKKKKSFRHPGEKVSHLQEERNQLVSDFSQQRLQSFEKSTLCPAMMLFNY